MIKRWKWNKQNEIQQINEAEDVFYTAPQKKKQQRQQPPAQMYIWLHAVCVVVCWFA